MREEIVTAVRYHPILRHEVVVRLTYTVGEGPRPDIVRRFLVKEEVYEMVADKPNMAKGFIVDRATDDAAFILERIEKRWPSE